MKKFLLPEAGQFYKANLHCHTTVSDGNLTPEEVKALYKDNGYSVVAFTDHNVLIPHPELEDEDFLALHGVELSVYSEGTYAQRKACHFCLIAREPENFVQPCYHRSKYCAGANTERHRPNVRFDESLPDYEREFTPACISDMMQTAREKGFFVTYNHPTWSLETADEYCNYHGMHAMEIYNRSSSTLGYNEQNDKEYDRMLRSGRQIFAVATDDNHNKYPGNPQRWDSFGGFTVIKAEKLQYKTVTDAMVAGHFYASQGPEIHALWVEDGQIHITCSEAERIVLCTGGRANRVACGESGELLTEASFELNPEQNYVRLMVYAADGKWAATNAYFVDELLEEE